MQYYTIKDYFALVIYLNQNTTHVREGRREGRQESLINVAKKMLMEKVDIDFITKITGLKKEQFVK